MWGRSVCESRRRMVWAEPLAVTSWAAHNWLGRLAGAGCLTNLVGGASVGRVLGLAGPGLGVLLAGCISRLGLADRVG
jgi:hypothetical protein